jgi:ubiquinone/menaquinone biosynthesis C-methylase UbiE
MRRGNYAEQARTYDRTRHASPTVLAALREKLGPARGELLLDAAGGTGNYAAALATDGFRPVVVDAEPVMLAVAASKLSPGSCVAADVSSLPFRDASFDRAILVSALHLFADKLGALREVHRILRSGPFLLHAFTRENLRPLLSDRYFAGRERHGPRETEREHAELLRDAGFRVIESRRLVYRGLEDGSLTALQTRADLIADEDYLRNTSYWQDMEESVRRAGLRRLQADLRSGKLQRKVEEGLRRAERWGHSTVFVASP